MRKYYTFKSLCLLAVFVFAGFGAKAQFSHLEQSFFLNFNAPMSQFSDDVAKNALGEYLPMTRFNVGKNASFGFGLGYRISYRFDVGFGEVSPYIHGDFQWNRVKADVREQYLDAGNGSAPNYFNIPIYVGVNYRYQLSDIFTPFGEFGIGPDIFMITKEVGSYNREVLQPGATETTTENVDLKLRYKTTTNLAWQIGAGSYFGQHVSLSVHYSGYGRHAIQYSSGTELPTDELKAEDAAVTKTETRGIGLLTFRIGFHF